MQFHLCEEPRYNVELSGREGDGELLFQGVQTFGVSGPPWKKESCFGPHVKYANTNEN